MNENKKLAKDSLTIAQNTPDENDGTNPQAMTALAFAQAYATLYLAEQQRLANLIALFKLDANDFGDFATQGFSFAQASLEIREGLGL